MNYHFPLFNNLTLWYTQNKRNLPWRNSNDPYIIWISEIIFQQTRIEQGLPFFQRFVEKFPDVFSLARSNDNEISSVWQGLGYYSRAKNALITACFVVDQYNGIFPDSYDHLLKLRGIGPYTAAAIASIAFKTPVPAIDGNAKRVGARLFLIKEDISSSSFQKQLSSILQQNIDAFDPSIFNQAIMELGALICLPKNPKCNICPISDFCMAGLTNQQNFLPVSVKKITKKNWHIDFFVIENNDVLFFVGRSNQKIWNNLSEFPNLSSEQPMTMNDWRHSELFNQWFGDNNDKEFLLMEEMQHQLSHRNIHARFWKMPVPKNIPPGWEPINIYQNNIPPLHVLIRNFLMKHYPIISKK